jgi:hypothetical protein
MIGKVQEHLEAIYGFRCAERAERFLVDRDGARRLGGTARAPEELLVSESEEDGALEVALYLSPRLLTQARAFESAPERMMEVDLEGYCQVTEGVSHFLYLARAADLERRVSLLELEAQAEVDKFASCVLRRWASPAAHGVGAILQWARQLLGRLFHAVRYHPHLTPAERWRYEEANRLSRNYCQRLLPHLSARRLDRLLSELRHMYRLGAEAKLQYLALGAG